MAAFLAGRARAARLALVEGVVAAVWSHRGRPRAVFGFWLSGAGISRITVETDAGRLRDLDIVFLPGDRERR